MAIEIYDKAAIVKKERRYYYLLKYGSKNSFTCPGQYVTGNDFRRKYLRGLTRDSHWGVIAHGGEAEHAADKIAETQWNSSTGGVYGQIRFGNNLNIAQWYVKNKERPLDYAALDDEQQSNIDGLLRYIKGEGAEWTIDLANIQPGHGVKTVDTYCSSSVPMDETNSVLVGSHRMWALNNL